MNEEKIFNLIFFEIFENQKAEDLKVCGVKYILEVICASDLFLSELKWKLEYMILMRLEDPINQWV